MNLKAPHNSDSSIAGEWYWLSGASSGIGFAVAEVLAALGAKLILMARNQNKLEIAKQNLMGLGAAEVEIFRGDVTELDTPSRARQFLSKRQLKGVLLNSGGPHGKRPSELASEDLMQAHNELFHGPVMLLQSLLPCVKRPGGSIVAITSTTVKEVNPNLPLSGAYRGALVALLKNFSEEFGEAGIRFNNVAPGYTATEKLRDLASYVAESSYGNKDQKALDAVYKDWGKGAALRRVAHPREVGEACAFLFSDRSSFVTGQTLMVDGGITRGY